MTFTSLPGWTTPAAQTVTITSGANTPVTGTYTKNTYTLTVQSSPPTGIAITSSTGDGGTANYTVSSIPYGTASVEPGGPGDEPDRVHLLAVDGGRQAAAFRPEVHHVPDDRRRDCGGVVRHGEQLHAGRAVHAAGRDRYHFEHRPGRDDGVLRGEHRLRDERERAGPGDGPVRLHLLEVDAERHGADCGPGVHHVHDGRGHDGRGAVHAAHLHADRAVHANARAEHRFGHGPGRHDKLHGFRPVRYERLLVAPTNPPGTSSRNGR